MLISHATFKYLFRISPGFVLSSRRLLFHHTYKDNTNTNTHKLHLSFFMYMKISSFSNSLSFSLNPITLDSTIHIPNISLSVFVCCVCTRYTKLHIYTSNKTVNFSTRAQGQGQIFLLTSYSFYFYNNIKFYWVYNIYITRMYKV